MHLARIEAACTWTITVCYLHRNPAVTFQLYASFIQMLDAVYKHHADFSPLANSVIFIYAKTTLILGFYSCSLWTCSAHYITHMNNTHFIVINTNRSHLYKQP